MQSSVGLALGGATVNRKFVSLNIPPGSVTRRVMIELTGSPGNAMICTDRNVPVPPNARPWTGTRIGLLEVAVTASVSAGLSESLISNGASAPGEFSATTWSCGGEIKGT